MKIKVLLERYQTILQKNKIKMHINLWLLLALLFGTALLVVLTLFSNILLGIVGFLVVFDLFIGYPLFLEEKRISQIEEFFPSALREISFLLKSGGTYEYAIRELTSYDYGPLNQELETVLLRLEQGYNFEDSLSIISENVSSELVRKTITIIIDSIKAGASMSDILEDLAEDMRKLHKLDLDRRAKTTLQVLFVFVAGSLIAPAIYGLVLTIIDFLLGVTSGAGLATIEEIALAKSVRSLIENVITMFVFVQTLASSFLVVIMREKKFSKLFLYLPLFLLCAYVSFYFIKFISKYLLIGMI